MYSKTNSNGKLIFDAVRFKPGYSSRALFFATKPELDRRVAEELLAPVVLGKQDQAYELLKKRSGLVLLQGKAVDYCGRTIIGTAFQAAIAAGDQPMWEMILPYFEDQSEALRQLNEQFPQGLEDEVSAEELKDYYNGLALAIINDSDEGLSTIANFRQNLTQQTRIAQGKYFNLQHLIAAYQAYIDNFPNPHESEITEANSESFWIKVIGFVQRQITAYDAQCLCSSLKKLLADKKSFIRSLAFRNDENFFSPDPKLNSGLGYSSAAYICSEGAMNSVVIPAVDQVQEACKLLKQLCQMKTDALNQLKASLENGMTYQPD